MCEERRSETGSLNERETRKMEETRKSVCMWVCTVQRPCMCMCCLCICVSRMDSLWPGRINSPPDWLQVSGNVTGEPERDLIAIRELPLSSRGQRAANFHVCVNTEQLHSSTRAENCWSLRGRLTSVWQVEGVWTNQVASSTSPLFTPLFCSVDSSEEFRCNVAFDYISVSLPILLFHFSLF